MGKMNLSLLIDITGNILLFCLVFGMSATVDITSLQAQLKNRKAILLGLTMQFVVLPFLGFAVVKLLNLGHVLLPSVNLQGQRKILYFAEAVSL